MFKFDRSEVEQFAETYKRSRPGTKRTAQEDVAAPAPEPIAAPAGSVETALVETALVETGVNETPTARTNRLFHSEAKPGKTRDLNADELSRMARQYADAAIKEFSAGHPDFEAKIESVNPNDTVPFQGMLEDRLHDVAAIRTRRQGTYLVVTADALNSTELVSDH